MFRKTLEGRFVLDVILQSAIAASALAHEYLISVLHTSARAPEGSSSLFRLADLDARGR
jgi:hypothetical protein